MGYKSSKQSDQKSSWYSPELELYFSGAWAADAGLRSGLREGSGGGDPSDVSPARFITLGPGHRHPIRDVEQALSMCDSPEQLQIRAAAREHLRDAPEQLVLNRVAQRFDPQRRRPREIAFAVEWASRGFPPVVSVLRAAYAPAPPSHTEDRDAPEYGHGKLPAYGAFVHVALPTMIEGESKERGEETRPARMPLAAVACLMPAVVARARSVMRERCEAEVKAAVDAEHEARGHREDRLRKTEERIGRLDGGAAERWPDELAKLRERRAGILAAKADNAQTDTEGNVRAKWDREPTAAELLEVLRVATRDAKYSGKKDSPEAKAGQALLDRAETEAKTAVRLAHMRYRLCRRMLRPQKRDDAVREIDRAMGASR